MTQDLTKGRPFSTVLRFSLPVIGGNLFQLFYTLADSIIVGRTLGSDALAAVGATGIIVSLMLCFVQGVTGGFGICLGHACGRKDDAGMGASAAASLILSTVMSVVLTILCCALAHPILRWMRTPDSIYTMAYEYLFAVLLGTGATVFYNLISNILRALGDSRTPLICLIVSSVLNIGLDLLFIVPLGMGVAGAAWATVLSQLLAALMSMIAGWRNFSVLRLTRSDFRRSRSVLWSHLKTGFPMGFQMSVMCIGQLAMQSAVNAMGPDAIAGYTAATKVDQVSVLLNNAMGVAISSYVAQNYGAGQFERIRAGVTACFMQTTAANIVLCALVLWCRSLVAPLFVSHPTEAVSLYAAQYLMAVGPFYVIMGMLLTYRSSVQSMGNGVMPFLACIVELAARITATTVLPAKIGYFGICLATPLAWIGACALLVPVYFHMMRKHTSLHGSHRALLRRRLS